MVDVFGRMVDKVMEIVGLGGSVFLFSSTVYLHFPEDTLFFVFDEEVNMVNCFLFKGFK